MANVSQADADYYQAISQAVAKTHAKAVLRKAAAYAKAKAAMPSPRPLPTAKAMRSFLQRPEVHAQVGVLTRALDARARPIAGMPDPPQGFKRGGVLSVFMAHYNFAMWRNFFEGRSAACKFGHDGIQQQITRNRQFASKAFAIISHSNRGVKRRRDEPYLNQYVQAGDVAEDVMVLNAAISNTLEMYMDENGIPDE